MGAISLPLCRVFATKPTTVFHCDFDSGIPVLKRLPMGSLPGQYLRAISELITATLRSPPSISRPLSSGMFMARK